MENQLTIQTNVDEVLKEQLESFRNAFSSLNGAMTANRDQLHKSKYPQLNLIIRFLVFESMEYEISDEQFE